MTETSEYQETYDSCNAICPYCGHSYQVEAENYTNDGEAEDEECDECHRVYERHTQFEVTHCCTPKENNQPNQQHP